jgi:tetratricopeptide (TPR) repeat protein
LVQIELKKAGDAMETLEALLQDRSGGQQAARAHYWRGVLLSEKSKWDQAEQALRACLAATPDAQTEALARLRLAVVLQRQDRMDEAADQIDPLLADPLRVAENPALVEWVVRGASTKGSTSGPCRPQRHWPACARGVLAADRLVLGRRQPVATGAGARRRSRPMRNPWRSQRKPAKVRNHSCCWRGWN